MPIGRVVLLPTFSVIVAEGSDAEHFLQGQLTNSLQALGASQHQRTGYCSAKGRLLAIAQLWRIAPQRIGMVVPSDIAPGLVRRLSMFVLRAKVNIGLAQASVQGCWGEGLPEAGVVSHDPAEDGAFLLGLGTSSQGGSGPAVSRAFRVSFAQHESAPDVSNADGAAQWMAADIVAGIPWIDAATQDLFVPQMVNLELLGGVNFQKGCYPGQEVVARSQYLGKLNRRMFGVTFSAATPPASASAIFNEHAPEQPCGSLVACAVASPIAQVNALAADQTPTHYVGLISVSLDAWASGALRMGEPPGVPLVPVTLPYEVPTTPQTPNRPKL